MSDNYCGTESKNNNSAKSSCDSKPAVSSCCDSDTKKIDYLMWVSGTVVGIFYFWHLSGITAPTGIAFEKLDGMGHAVFDLLNTMAWGAAFGIVMVAILSKLPREIVISALGTNSGIRGLVRATGAGILLDLCSHGILMVGAKLYERGVSTGQVMAFLIASPWNSFSLTLILVALIGLNWTLAFIVLSIIIALLTGTIFDVLVKKGILPKNPNTCDLPENYHFLSAVKAEIKKIRFTPTTLGVFALDGLKESRMVLRWLLFGIVLASIIRVFVPADIFGTYFGPTVLGLAVTLVTATVLEVCSEGSTPIAADIFNRANAPGNSFAFLMTGVSTDYTEIMVLKDTTKSWKLALFLPLITLPQIIIIVGLINLSP